MRLTDAVSGYLMFKSSRAAPTTIKTDTVCLGQFADWLGDVEVQNIRPEDVRGFLAHETQRGLSAFSVKRQYAVVSALYTWLTDPEIHLAETNPTDIVDPPRLPRTKPKALSRDTIEALLHATDRMTLPRRARALVLFLTDTGARASEVCGVAMQDADLKTGKVLLRHTKNSKERFVFLGSRARSATWLYVSDERPEPRQVRNDMLFLSHRGYPLNRNSLRRALLRLADEAGVNGVTTHAFRHTAAVTHLRNGMDLVSLQHLLGHADITTTRGYLTALADEDVQQTAMRTSPADNWRL